MSITDLGVAAIAGIVGFGIEQDGLRTGREAQLFLACQKTSADSEDEVRLCQDSAASKPGERERVAIVEGAAAVRAHDDRAVQVFCERFQRFGSVTGNDPAASVNCGSFGTGEELGCFSDLVVVRFERLVMRDGVEQRDLGCRLEEVRRHLQTDWTRAATAQLPHRFMNESRNLLRRLGSR